MNPNNQNDTDLPRASNNLPPIQESIGSASSSLVSSTSPDDIFVIKTPGKKPLDKKSIISVVILSVLGILILFAVLLFALIASAGALADDYRRLEIAQLDKIDTALASFEPSAVINQQSIDKPLETVVLSEQSQPSLENVLFIGQWSQKYSETELSQAAARKHYQEIKTYAQHVKELLFFNTTVQAIFNQDPELVNAVKPNDSFSIRAVSGSYEVLTKKINDTPAPPQIKSLKNELITVYKNKSAAYFAWARAVEQGKTDEITKSQQDIAITSTTASTLTSDENYASSLQPSYKKLINNHKELKQALRD